MSSSINQEAILSGTISIQETLLSGQVYMSEASLSGIVSIPSFVSSSYYEGEYVVTPKVETNSVLPTNGKQMLQDVTVLKIPQFEVSNESGGKTLIIGEEYYYG